MRPSTSSLSVLKRSPTAFFAAGRSGLEPASGDVVEAALLAADPAEAEGFYAVGVGDRRGFVGGLFGEMLQRLDRERSR